MTDVPANVLTREDTLLGVCQAIGDDFGFNPLWLRVAFAACLYWNPAAVVGTYLGLGIIVAISRLVIRNPRPVRAEPEATVAIETVGESEPLPLAA
jgi:phage shock protein PspC (stress-responsive transcriptional regulator)